eukprot:SAG31_NODE_27317_length_428_cov_0.623100_1_plen_36_part_10
MVVWVAVVTFRTECFVPLLDIASRRALWVGRHTFRG